MPRHPSHSRPPRGLPWVTWDQWGRALTDDLVAETGGCARVVRPCVLSVRKSTQQDDVHLRRCHTGVFVEKMHVCLITDTQQHAKVWLSRHRACRRKRQWATIKNKKVLMPYQSSVHGIDSPAWCPWRARRRPPAHRESTVLCCARI